MRKTTYQYSGTSVFDLLPIQTIQVLTKKCFRIRIELWCSNTWAGNRKEPSGVKTHSTLDLARTKRAEWSQNTLGGQVSY